MLCGTLPGRNECYAHLYVGDFFADTLHLTASEHRALRRLLLASWVRDLSLDDDRALAATAGLAPRSWRKVKPPIVSVLVDMRPRIAESLEQLRLYDGRRLPSSLWRIVRSIVFERDGYECKYCGAERNLEGDHIIPLRHGGSNLFGNVTTACRPCNLSKGAKTPEEWYAARHA